MDDDGANERCECIDDAENFSPKRANVKVKCTVHKKYAIVNRSVPIFFYIDSRWTTMVLSARETRNGIACARQYMREPIADQLCIVYVSEVSIEDQQHTVAVYDTYSQHDHRVISKQRESIIRSLFNYKIHEVGIVYHSESGCCKDP